MAIAANRESMLRHRAGTGFEMLLRRRVTPAIGMTLVAIVTFLWAPAAVAREAPDADAGVAVEAEFRWNVLSRWAVVGFLGCGATDGDLVHFESEAPLLAGGIGVRYLFADDLGLWVGVDVARGPEDYVGYLQVGHAW